MRTTIARDLRLLLLAAAMLAGMGCRPAAQPVARDNRYPTGIITPQAGDALAGSGCLGVAAEPQPADLVQDLVLGYIVSRRDFKEPAGPDGYVLSISPLNNQEQCEPVAGASLTICLYEHPAPGRPLDGARRVRMWQLTDYETSLFWARTRLLDCYLLFLDWGEPVTAANNLLFTVQMDYVSGGASKTLCKRLSVHQGAGN